MILEMHFIFVSTYLPLSQRKKCEYAEMVRKQIEEQENQRRKEREEFFTEGKMLHEEAEARRRRLNEIKQRKLQELKVCSMSSCFNTKLIIIVIFTHIRYCYQTVTVYSIFLLFCNPSLSIF